MASRRSVSRFLVADRSAIILIYRQQDIRREPGTTQDDAARPERPFQCVYQQEIITELLIYEYPKEYPTTFQTQNNPNMYTNLCKYMKSPTSANILNKCYHKHTLANTALTFIFGTRKRGHIFMFATCLRMLRRQ